MRLSLRTAVLLGLAGFVAACGRLSEADLRPLGALLAAGQAFTREAALKTLSYGVRSR